MQNIWNSYVCVASQFIVNPLNIKFENRFWIFPQLSNFLDFAWMYSESVKFEVIFNTEKRNNNPLVNNFFLHSEYWIFLGTLKMSSANPHTAKNIFSDTKRRLSERVSMNIHNTASVAREIIRGKEISIELDLIVERKTSIYIFLQVQSQMTLSSLQRKVSQRLKSTRRIAWSL